jgi:hypothetical protein
LEFHPLPDGRPVEILELSWFGTVDPSRTGNRDPFANEPELSRLLATVEGETRHAELAWRVVAWALRAGGAKVRRVAEQAFATFEPPRAPVITLEGVDLDAFAAHGRLTPDDARSIALEVLEALVRPCAAALLERDVMTHLRGRFPVAEVAVT